MSQHFTGAGVALITPFTGDEKIDFKALTDIVENQVNGGMDFLVALGTTAETATLTSSEKREVVNLVKNNSGNLPVVVGMGGNSTQNILDEIDAFDFKGVDGILVVTPYYNKPSQEGMYRHYSEIAKASPVPIILYNVPSRTGINLEANTVIKLAENFENIVAVKEASGIISQITQIVKYSPAHFNLISGDDVLALPITSVGGKGIISVIANAIPGKLSKLIHLALDNDYSGAREIQIELVDLLKLLFKEGNPGGIKALMHYQGTIENVLRSPLYKITDETYTEIKEAYLKLNML